MNRHIFSAPALLVTLASALILSSASSLFAASPAQDAEAVAALDTQYQDAVKRNDAVVMDRILADDFALVVGTGATYTKADLLESARTQAILWERQEEEPGTQKVRLWGDTAVVTAQLWLKGTKADKPIDKKLWFSDTYVRTPAGWRYVFGQASLAPPAPATEAR